MSTTAQMIEIYLQTEVNRLRGVKLSIRVSAPRNAGLKTLHRNRIIHLGYLAGNL